jgi:hypothetical protein
VLAIESAFIVLLLFFFMFFMTHWCAKIRRQKIRSQNSYTQLDTCMISVSPGTSLAPFVSPKQCYRCNTEQLQFFKIGKLSSNTSDISHSNEKSIYRHLCREHVLDVSSMDPMHQPQLDSILTKASPSFAVVLESHNRTNEKSAAQGRLVKLYDTLNKWLVEECDTIAPIEQVDLYGDQS